MPVNMAAAARLLQDHNVAVVLDLLNGNGEEARLVGGAVRNVLLGRAAKDHDIATTAEPRVVMERAAQKGLRVLPTGLPHGTVTILVAGRPFEVTTLREDVKTDGRHATIRFGRDFSRDALRRDFTINALSMGPDGIVHDYAGGIDDLAKGCVRFIGGPGLRIREDYLRILRFYRFSAEYASDAFDGEAVAATIRERAGLSRLSRERVRQEVLKLLVAPRAVEAARTMSEAGLLGPMLGGVPQPARLARLIAAAPGADATLRLAALACQIVEDAERLRTALKLSKAEAKAVADIANVLTRLHAPQEAPSPRRLRELLYQFGRKAAQEGVLLASAEFGSTAAAVPAWQAASRFLEDTPEPRLPFAAADLMAAGLKPGRALGDALKALQADWIRAGFPQDPQRLADLLQARLGPPEVDDADRDR